MSLISKKETLTKSIPLMAIMAAINIVFAFIEQFVPFLSVILVIVLPLTSSIVEISCKDRYFPIYALATVGLSLIVSISTIQFTIFYIIPSIITGYIFGLMIKRNIAPVWAILLATIAQALLSFGFIPLLELITEHNLIEDIKVILNLSETSVFNDFVIVIFFLIALVQVILSFIVVYHEAKKLENYEVKKEYNLTLISVSLIISISLFILFFFISKEFCYFFYTLALFFSFFIIYENVAHQKFKRFIVYGIVLLLNIFLYAIFNPIINNGIIILFIAITPLFLGVFSLFVKNN